MTVFITGSLFSWRTAEILFAVKLVSPNDSQVAPSKGESLSPLSLSVLDEHG